jgi:hypothetical protein
LPPQMQLIERGVMSVRERGMLGTMKKVLSIVKRKVGN